MVQSNATQANKPVIDRVFIERERNRFASRALSLLVFLNGASALILLMVMALAPDATVDGKVAAALLFFSVGAIFALLSAFLAYINRTIRLEQPGRRENLRSALRGFAIATVIGSGAAFLTGMNMVATAKVEKPSSQSKGPQEDNRLKSGPSEEAAEPAAEEAAAEEPADE
jgi:ABC-type multidrug transport system fused ATPase/permease subunit